MRSKNFNGDGVWVKGIKKLNSLFDFKIVLPKVLKDSIISTHLLVINSFENINLNPCK